MVANDGEEDCNKNEPGDTSHPVDFSVSLSVDAILSLLSNHQRRDLLSYLREVPDRTASLDECVGHLMERGEERIGERPGHDQVETALYHIHIPKLADSGVLEYDARSLQLHYCGDDRLEDWHDHIQSK